MDRSRLFEWCVCSLSFICMVVNIPWLLIYIQSSILFNPTRKPEAVASGFLVILKLKLFVVIVFTLSEQGRRQELPPKH